MPETDQEVYANGTKMALDSQHGDINLVIEEISNLTGGLVDLKPASTAEEIILTIFKYLKQFVTDKNAVYETNCRLLNQILGSKQDAKRLRIVFEAISMLETDVGDNLCWRQFRSVGDRFFILKIHQQNELNDNDIDSDIRIVTNITLIKSRTISMLVTYLAKFVANMGIILSPRAVNCHQLFCHLHAKTKQK